MYMDVHFVLSHCKLENEFVIRNCSRNLLQIQSGENRVKVFVKNCYLILFNVRDVNYCYIILLTHKKENIIV